MLDLVAAEHFAALEGHAHEFEIPGGARLVLRVDMVKLKPAARGPSAEKNLRTPFSVGLTALEPTAFVDGLCTTDLPGLGRLEGVMVSRQAALGRDPQLAYFQILFN